MAEAETSLAETEVLPTEADSVGRAEALVKEAETVAF